MVDKVVRDIVVNFALGGAAVAATSYLGTFLSPLAGAIFWAYPITILPTIFFMRQQNKSNSTISKFLLGTTFALILLMGVTYLLSYTIAHASPAESLWIPVLKSTVGFLAGGALYYLIIKLFGLSKYFT
jgi:uncharacterized membrane protein